MDANRTTLLIRLEEDRSVSVVFSTTFMASVLTPFQRS